MRIGLFTNNYCPLVNGLATSVETFAQAFRRAGHAVTVVAPRYPGGPVREEGVLRVPGLRAPTHHAYILPLSGWPGVGSAVAALQLDVFHAQHPLLLGAAAARWARRANRPLVFTYHTHYDRYAHYVPGPSRLVAWLAIRQAAAFANRADLVVAPGRAVARRLRAQGVQTRIAIVPTGVPLTATSAEAPRIALRQLLGLVECGPLCLAVGRLAKEKNQAFLLSAFARILQNLPGARLVFVGEGDDRPRLERLAHTLGIRGHVRFVGAVSHNVVSSYYQAADLFLFPSTSETQGIVVLEALAAGLPVVAVASEAATELLGEYQGSVLTPEDPECFARSVVGLWDEPEQRQAMAEAGRRIAARYAPDACAATLLGLYEEVRQSYEVIGARADAAIPKEART
jgi:1,2-diacylglycerol 3-alpha-glucosyltransferase